MFENDDQVLIAVQDTRESQALSLCFENWISGTWAVRQVHDGETALAFLDQNQPELVLVDLHLPAIDGLTMLREAKKRNPYVKVVLMAPTLEYDAVRLAIRENADDFLLKPVAAEVLAASVAVLLEDIRRDTEELIRDAVCTVTEAVTRKQYRQAQQRVYDCVNLFYECYHSDLEGVRKAASRLMVDLGGMLSEGAAVDFSGLQSRMRDRAYFIGHYGSRHELKKALMKAVDMIFDAFAADGKTSKNNIQDIINYVDRYCNRDITLEQVAQYANMTSFYVSKLFKKETGENYVAYLTKRKMDLAVDMLIYSEIPVVNIALELSYHEPNYFSKVFKKQMGLTPTEYRKKYKKV